MDLESGNISTFFISSRSLAMSGWYRVCVSLQLQPLFRFRHVPDSYLPCPCVPPAAATLPLPPRPRVIPTVSVCPSSCSHSSPSATSQGHTYRVRVSLQLQPLFRFRHVPDSDRHVVGGRRQDVLRQRVVPNPVNLLRVTCAQTRALRHSVVNKHTWCSITRELRELTCCISCWTGTRTGKIDLPSHFYRPQTN